MRNSSNDKVQHGWLKLCEELGKQGKLLSNTSTIPNKTWWRHREIDYFRTEGAQKGEGARHTRTILSTSDCIAQPVEGTPIELDPGDSGQAARQITFEADVATMRQWLLDNGYTTHIESFDLYIKFRGEADAAASGTGVKEENIRQSWTRMKRALRNHFLQGNKSS